MSTRWIVRRSAERRAATRRLQWRGPLRGRLMVGRLTLDQVVKVRVLAPQLRKAAAQAAFVFRARRRKLAWGNAGGNTARSGMFAAAI